MNFFLTCPSSCVYPGFFSFEGICPILNGLIFFLYISLLINLGLLIYNKSRKDKK